MVEIGYQGTYVRFKTEDRDTAMGWMSLDNAVGDLYTIESKYENGMRSDWIVNAAGQEMGLLDAKFADKLDLMRARGWDIATILSFVAFTEAKDDEPGLYWGEVAVIAYDPNYSKAFTGFVSRMQKEMGNGIRPDLKIGKNGLSEIVKTDGDYLPSGRKPLPQRQKGTAFVKTERSANEKLVEQAKKGNKGCYAATYLFYAVLIFAVIYGVHLLGFF